LAFGDKAEVSNTCHYLGYKVENLRGTDKKMAKQDIFRDEETSIIKFLYDGGTESQALSTQT